MKDIVFMSLIVIQVTVMHHTAKVLTPLVWRTRQASTKLTFLYNIYFMS
jgi:hypothetical protein